MTLPTSLSFGAPALELSDVDGERHGGGGRWQQGSAGWWRLAYLARTARGEALLRSRSIAVEAAAERAVQDEVELWAAPEPESVVGESPPPEWLFWGFLMCMAIAALPFIGIRWTTPPTALSGALEDAMMLALPDRRVQTLRIGRHSILVRRRQQHR